ncbi:MAG: sigma 54-dependent Fis family transcriptional regulator [Myxococcales bacterium]|nr:sigma 54-dependent Fis family transcriptional regulator [Myxococcales bacterium]MCB9706480.1 sigma 54-dependent Fis family transcriptional regulator [Myxococcales bacterium]
MPTPKPPEPDGLTTTFAPPTASRQIRRVLLRVSEGPDAGAQIQVSRSRLTVGRAAVNDLVLGDTSVSGIHAEILLDRRGILLRDLGSTNGTQVQGVRIREAWIEPGMTLEVGKTAITLLAADEVDVPLSRRDHFGALYGGSPAMREVFAVLERIAGTEMSVLIHGETGTGKELVARALHDESPRERRPFVVLDCGSLPRELAEASILGHKKGSFTGALTDRPGAFEEAEGGTLFLDEIGELPLELQPKLLRVLDRREVQRLGEHQVRKVDVRVVAATHRDLRTMVSQGEFREDLYFRLSVMMVELPPLRDRGDDIVLIAERFLEAFRRARGDAPSLGPAARRALLGERWPGNVRELKNTIERAAYLARGGVIEPSDLHLGRRPPPRPAAPESPSAAPQAGLPVADELFTMPFKEAKQAVIDDFERRYFTRLLDAHDGNLSRAAAEAGITRYYLRELVKRLKVPRGKEDDE